MILPLRVTNLTFSAGGRPIIDDVSLSIEAGPSTVILGANGAGKSVLMRLMHGLLAPTSGRVEWQADAAPHQQAMVFQRPVMLRRSALANVVYALESASVPQASKLAMEALAEVGLAHVALRPARVASAAAGAGPPRRGSCARSRGRARGSPGATTSR